MSEMSVRLSVCPSVCPGTIAELLDIIGELPGGVRPDDLQDLRGMIGDRVKQYLGNTYRIFENKSVLPFAQYRPTEEARRKVKDIFVVPNLNNSIQGSYYCLSILLSKKLSKRRFDIINHLKSKGIGSSIYYPSPVPRLNYYKNKYNTSFSNYKIASEYSDKIICFPIGPHVVPKSLNYISAVLKKYINLIR